MTHPTITCERFNETLADFLERALSEPARAAMEAHAVGCSECGPLLADLRRLRIDAANLPELSPSRDLWSGIADRIEAPVVAFPGSPSVRQRRWGRYVSFGVAAAALIAVTATITHRMDGGPGGHTNGGPVDRLTGGPKANSGQTAAVTPSVSLPVDSGPPVHRSTGQPVSPTTHLASNAKPSAQQTYDREITKLLVVYNQRRPDLDSTTVAIVKKNLKIIDEAIAQTKLALKRDPASEFLMESLNDAFDTKIQLLRKVAMLPSGS